MKDFGELTLDTWNLWDHSFGQAFMSYPSIESNLALMFDPDMTTHQSIYTILEKFNNIANLLLLLNLRNQLFETMMAIYISHSLRISFRIHSWIPSLSRLWFCLTKLLNATIEELFNHCRVLLIPKCLSLLPTIWSCL